MLKRIAMAFAIVAAAAAALETGASFVATGNLGIGLAAHARVGRPLTPVSVARCHAAHGSALCGNRDGLLGIGRTVFQRQRDVSSAIRPSSACDGLR